MDNNITVFKEQMKKLLGSDYSLFEQSLKGPLFRGIRVNTLKFSAQKLKSFFGDLSKTPFCDNGFYLPEDFEGIGLSPLHHAGAFYVQEPSAMSAVEILNPKPGEKVLDLCAAPGGKSTQIAAALSGIGLLVANEYVPARAKKLLSNIERCGVKNAIVTNNRPDVLCSRLEGFFDKVLVDAPCSGEGMFRKNPEAIKEWSPSSAEDCAKRQLAILDSAKNALKEGGELVYSTCTFNSVENEGVIEKFLKLNPDFELLDAGNKFGTHISPDRAGCDFLDTSKLCRIFPFNGGEGHFAARLRRTSSAGRCGLYKYKAYKDKLFYQFWESNFTTSLPERLLSFGTSVFLLPEEMPDLKGIRVLRAGVLAGEGAKNRFEPAHALYMSLKPEEVIRKVELTVSSKEASAFLRGYEIPCEGDMKGYAGVFIEGVSCGFGKASGGVLKNHYPKGLRMANLA